MKSSLLAFVSMLLSVVTLSAQIAPIERFLYAGPVVLQAPVMLDTIDAIKAQLPQGSFNLDVE